MLKYVDSLNSAISSRLVLALVAVVDDGEDVVHVEGDGIGVNKEEHCGQHEGHGEA